jgi:hypothetical protein
VTSRTLLVGAVTVVRAAARGDLVPLGGSGAVDPAPQAAGRVGTAA